MIENAGFQSTGKVIASSREENSGAAGKDNVVECSERDVPKSQTSPMTKPSAISGAHTLFPLSILAAGYNKR